MSILIMSGKSHSAAWFGYRPPQLLGSGYPFINDTLGIGHRFDITGTVRHAAGKLGNFGHKGLIGVAPVNDQLILSHHRAPRADISELCRVPV